MASAHEFQSSNNKSFENFEKLYYDYLRKLGEVWDRLVKTILDAQNTYTQAINQAGVSQQTAEAGMNDYAEAVRAAWNESQTQYSDAYTTYLGAYRDAWAGTNFSELSPQVVSIILQSASTVAAYAASTIGNWWLIAWAGVPLGPPTSVSQPNLTPAKAAS